MYVWVAGLHTLAHLIPFHRCPCYCPPLNTCPPPCCLPQTSEEYYACTWSLDVDSGAPLLLLAGKNGVLVVVNVATGSLETCFEGHGSSINDVAVHPAQPQFVATASRDHSLRLWNLRTRWVGGWGGRWVGGWANEVEQPAGLGTAKPLGAAPLLCAGSDVAYAACAAQARMGRPPARSRRLLACYAAGAAC